MKISCITSTLRYAFPAVTLFNPGIVYVRPLPYLLQVRIPLGIAAELLRASHVSAAAASVLALLPPSLSTPGERMELHPAVGVASLSTDSPVLRENAAFRCAVVGLLRLIASVLAGAAVSCVGGGDWVRHVRLIPDSKTRRLWLSRGSVNLRQAPVSLGGERRVSNVGSRRGNGGEEDGSDGQERRRDGEGISAESALASWFVPSGALGAALYTVSVEGVFGGFFREYFFGEAIQPNMLEQAVFEA